VDKKPEGDRIWEKSAQRGRHHLVGGEVGRIGKKTVADTNNYGGQQVTSVYRRLRGEGARFKTTLPQANSKKGRLEARKQKESTDSGKLMQHHLLTQRGSVSVYRYRTKASQEVITGSNKTELEKRKKRRQTAKWSLRYQRLA